MFILQKDWLQHTSVVPFQTTHRVAISGFLLQLLTQYFGDIPSMALGHRRFQHAHKEGIMNTLNNRTTFIVTALLALVGGTTLASLGTFALQMLAEGALLIFNLLQSLRGGAYTALPFVVGFGLTFALVKVFGDDVWRLVTKAISTISAIAPDSKRVTSANK